MEKEQTAALQHMVEELVSQARMFGNILTASADHIYMYDSEGRYLFANFSGAHALGLKPAEMIGKHWRDLGFPGEIMERFDVLRRSVMETGSPVTSETVFPTREGPRDFEYILTPVSDEHGLVEAVVCNVRDITERKKKETRFKKTEEIMRVLSFQFINVQEEERRHIARELHDEIGQALTAVKINLQSTQRLTDSIVLITKLDESISIVERALKQVRNLSLDLRPSLLDDIGLVSALRWYVERQAQRSGISMRFAGDLGDARFSSEIETSGFRIVQEALTNVVRHSDACDVLIQISIDKEEITLFVRDNGKGFDVGAARKKALAGGSLGLLGMEERVQLVGGRMKIKSEPGQGTEISVVIPAVARHSK